MKTLELKQLIQATQLPVVAQTQWWIDTLREHKDFIFVILRDWIDFLQCILDKKLLWEHKLVKESVIQLSWELIENKVVKLHQREFVISKIEILSTPIDVLPIWWETESYPSMEQRLDHRHISLREPKMHLLFQIASFAEYELRKYCFDKDFTEIHTPKLLWSPSESGAELFSLDYFDTKAYLAQSPQFYKQMAIASWFKKVFEVWPVFRAEASFTSRHVTEFTWLDFEIAYISSIEDVMQIEEDLIHYLFQTIKEKFWQCILEIFWFEIQLPQMPFPRIRFDECMQILQKEYWYKYIDWEDITWEWERLISQYVKQKFDHDFVFITHYPTAVRAFYTMKSDDSKRCESFDLLFKWLEITSWAQREHWYEQLKQQIIEKWMSIEQMQYYLDFFRYWIPPHGWFWIGLMRIFMKLFDFQNIKEVIFSPRDPKRLTP